MEENQSYADIVGRSSAPYLNHLARACGLATNYRGVTHPSHPNYMAVTGGIRTPAGYIDAPNIFRQVRQAGGSWRVYQEAMPRPCDRGSATPYKTGHNPGISYASIRSGCRLWDVGWDAFKRDVAAQPAPDIRLHHPGPVPQHARELHSWHERDPGRRHVARPGDPADRETPPDTSAAARRSSSPGTRARTARAPPSGARTACTLLHLEDQSCHVPTFILSQYVAPGTRSSLLFSHYSLLQTTERLLGLDRFLGHAADPTTTGMRAAFGF